MRLQSVLSVLVLSALALAGCADDAAGTDQVVDPNLVEETELEQGKGAIAGLVVDDRFRPIIGAEVLVQEAGITVGSNENGEFAVVDLEPGTYTLRVNAEGHEATPARIQVAEGEFAEAQLLARRVLSEGGSVLTQEFTVFIPCAADFIVNGIVANCVLDLSGDSYRSGFTVDYSEMGDTVSFLVTEVKLNQDGGYVVQVREDDGSTAGGQRYAVGRIPADATYYKMINEYGVINEVDNMQANNVAWTNQGESHPEEGQQNPVQTILFIDGEYKDELMGADPTGEVCCGLDARFGIKAQFVQSLFLGPPETDVETYAVLG